VESLLASSFTTFFHDIHEMAPATSPIFLKLRNVAFYCISFISFTWVILLCIIIFSQWSFMGRPERSLVVLMLLVNIVTFIILLVLMILEFRPWLDAARFLFLLIAHIGLASMFVVWRPKFDCPSDNPDHEGTCRLLSMYILVASWITPVLLVAYVVALALMLHKRRMRAHLLREDDAYPSANSGLPIMMPISTVHSPISITFPTRVATIFRHSDSSTSSMPSSSFPSDTSERKATRLSKLAPYAY